MGDELEVIKPTIFSIYSKERLDAFESLGKITLSSKMVVILHEFPLKFPELSVPDGVDTALLSFYGKGSVVWGSPTPRSVVPLASVSLIVSSGVLFQAYDMDIFKETWLVQFHSLSDLTLAGCLQWRTQPRPIDEIGKELEAAVEGGRFALMCGAGVSMALCQDSKSWWDFVEEYASVVNTIFGVDDDWLQGILAEANVMTRVTRIVQRINRATSIGGAGTDLELHRLVAQMIFNRHDVNDTFPARVLHNFNSLILTTNYDTLLEKAICSVNEIGEDRVTISHCEYMMLESPPVFNAVWGDGPFLATPLRRLVVHIHGRYFDVGPEHGFCLTQKEYEDDVALASFLRFMVPLAKQKSIIFVGATGSWLDLHFQSLWLHLAGSTIPHFVLANDMNYEDLHQNASGLNRLHDLNIIVVPFYNVERVADSFLRHAGLFTQLNALRIRCVRR
jgi:hypothetical protein